MRYFLARTDISFFILTLFFDYFFSKIQIYEMASDESHVRVVCRRQLEEVMMTRLHIARKFTLYACVYRQRSLAFLNICIHMIPTRCNLFIEYTRYVPMYIALYSHARDQASFLSIYKKKIYIHMSVFLILNYRLPYRRRRSASYGVFPYRKKRFSHLERRGTCCCVSHARMKERAYTRLST